MADLKDLEDYWKDLRVKKVEITPESEGPEALVERAIERLQEEMPQILKDAEFGYGGSGQGPLVRFVTLCLRVFSLSLLEETRRRDASFLIQLFLEGTEGLPTEDVRGFLSALPRQVIDRILARLEGTHSGLHALLSLEAIWRDGGLNRDYELRRDQDGRVVVTFYPKEVPDEVSFRLREIFETKT